MRKNSIRKRAQRAAPEAGKCQGCGAEGLVERHHPDYADPDRFEILCQPCHIKADQRDGHRKVKAMKACKVCGAMFLPSHSKKHTTCSKECLSEIGRQNAARRWGGPKSPPSLV